ncbi:brassinosteroid LRR receptor kinase-like [Pistacia vera]|uniref:brassinosteroid LRR receptor kinase-like n=1 Tax=Pistacia vera TaxID=55513 RepID=UPI001262DDF5|nr:brassinosteroid LRR receptor kinase-like [Pistacia vera]
MSVPPFGDCLALEHLDILANKFSFDIVHAISPCEKLTFLNISSNQFGGQVPMLSLAANLQYFLLGNNLFQGEIPLQLADSCPSLVKIDLSSNNLSGTVPNSFSSCSSLAFLDISYNKFSGELPVDTFLQMSSLKELVLSFNDFTGVLPHSLSELTNLETLDLSSNNFSACFTPFELQFVRAFDDQLRESRKSDHSSNCAAAEEQLRESREKISDQIRSGAANDPSLDFPHSDLNLWLNNLHGEIPQELGNIQTLQTLILDFNQLSGPVPSSLSNCTNLTWISLSNNQLSGEIPRWLGKLSNLAIPKLNNNSFYGSIPPELGDCRNLIWLDLNPNNLNGSIPPALFKQSGKIAVNFIAGKTMCTLRMMVVKSAMEQEICLSLEELDRSSRTEFHQESLGMIPEGGQLETFPPTKFVNNSGLCGLPLPPCGKDAALSANSQQKKSDRRAAAIVRSIAMGLLISPSLIV